MVDVFIGGFGAVGPRLGVVGIGFGMVARQAVYRIGSGIPPDTEYGCGVTACLGRHRDDALADPVALLMQ